MKVVKETLATENVSGPSGLKVWLNKEWEVGFQHSSWICLVAPQVLHASLFILISTLSMISSTIG